MSGQHSESSAARGYGYQWRKIRAEKLSKDPHCQIKGPNCTTKATQVDHRNENGPDAAHNLRSTCRTCHMEVTAKMVGLGTEIGVGRRNIAKNDPRYRGSAPARPTIHRAPAPSRPSSFGDSLRSGLSAMKGPR